MSKRIAGVGHKTPPDYELAGDWHLAAVKGRGLVTILAGGTCIFGLALILGVVARGILQGVGGVKRALARFLIRAAGGKRYKMGWGELENWGAGES